MGQFGVSTNVWEQRRKELIDYALDSGFKVLFERLVEPDGVEHVVAMYEAVMRVLDEAENKYDNYLYAIEEVWD